ncbi:glycerate kinase [Kitasatospora phosalacinea]|uniref:Glycerate kinase n=1 Tax=Kitasatospora phosalacinea TaxID=2065 RepID=A0A9W6V4D7_9ACTN|nr:glycerate kinase [Kitasatospora phosalacinea]GLW72122.1 glycerate kinase [Kitasatospora phosalacinea]
MRVVVAPDAFKGTIDAAAAADALAAGWRSVRAADEVRCLPMADGGEGTLAAVVSASPGARLFDVPGVTGPDGRPVPGRFALLPDGTAVVELATASGLPLLEGELLPLSATTRGTGETVAAALDAGARRLLLGLGGSASTDGGHGLLSALGARLRDGAGEQLPPAPADFDLDRALAAARTVDLSALRPAPPGGVVLLTDVTNPLLGARGAAAVYGPQKGAGEREVALLERRLARWSELLGGDPAAPGAGAAGGTGYGLAAAWGALVEPGAAAVAGLLGLPAAVAAADLVVTGEGSFDATSLQGKAVGEVVRIADGAGVPSAVVAGVSEAPGVLTLSALAGSPLAARRDPARWLHRAGAVLAAHHDAPRRS